MNKITFGVLCLIWLWGMSGFGQEKPSRGEDAQVPLGVEGGGFVGEGVHNISYTYSLILAEDLVVGNKTRKSSELLSSENPYLASSHRISRHYFAYGLGLGGSLSFFGTLSVEDHQMKIDRWEGETLEFDSHGLGDGGMGLVYEVFADPGSYLQWSTHLTWPLGGHKAQGRTASGADKTLPSVWQSGRSQVFAATGPRFVAFFHDYSWGAELLAATPWSEGKGYSEGSYYNLSSWLSWQTNPHYSLSLRWQRTQYQAYSGNTGLESDWGPTMGPDAGQSTYDEIFGGLNWRMLRHHFQFSYGQPVLQKADGVRVKKQSHGLAMWRIDY